MSTPYDPGASSANPYLNALLWGTAWNTAASNGQAANVITYSIDDESWGLGFTDAECTAINSAVQCFENICGIDFVRVDSTNPTDPSYYENIAFVAVDDSFSEGALGMADPPMTGNYLDADSNVSGVYLNIDGAGFTSNGLAQGGYGYVTLIHELGHAMGLAHPHDDGGISTLFPGVTAAFGDFGDYDLNQGIFTTMSYNDGWQSNFGTNPSLEFGYQGTPMAFDIAVMQLLYGANTSFQTGANTYVLPKVNSSGTFFSCLWDAGGNDTISNQNSSIACTIDLRAAPLTGTNAGGFVSCNNGIVGGYTIANGVIIENAIGGSGNDQITGNSAANTLNGGSGNDTLAGGTGNDIYITDGGDAITEGSNAGTDTVKSSATATLGLNVENLTLTGSLTINGTGNTLNNVITGNSTANTLNGGAGTDTLVGGSGDDIYVTDGGDTITEASGSGTGTDTVQSSATATLGLNVENLTLTGSLGISGTGNTLNNVITGNSGNNILNGGTGKDVKTGAAGNDTFIFNSVVESAITDTTTDVITDFVIGKDKMNLSAIDAFASSGSNDIFVWNGTAAFNSTTKGEVRYQKFDNRGSTNDYTMIWIDNDRDKDVEMAIRLTGLHNLTQSDFIL